MQKRIMWVVLLLATAVSAQDGPQTPRDLFELFIARTDKGELVSAGKLFDLSAIPAADRDEVARQAAVNLRSFLDRVTYEVPDVFVGNAYTLRTKDGDVAAEFSDADGWRFTATTLDAADELYAGVYDRDPVDKARAMKDGSLRGRMPPWLRRRIFLLDNWQWLGLLALALVAFLIGVVVRLVIARIGIAVARRRGAEIDRKRQRMRAFGMVAQAAVWLLLLRFLELPPKSYSALMFAGRLVLMVGVVWSVCRIVDWIGEIALGIAKQTDSKIDDLLVPMLRRAAKIFVVAIGIVWIADNLDMDIAALVAGLGIGGVALALASKDTVENFFGTVALLADRPFVVGDWIRMGNIEGTVEEVGFRSSRVRTFYNSLISFPNAMLIRSAVDNLGKREYRRVKETLGVTYDTPPDKLLAFVEGIRELIRNHPYTRRDYYHVYFHSFGPSSLDILLYCFLRCPDWATELRERQRLMLDILRLANELKVEFAFPTQTLHVVQGEAPEHPDAGRTVPAAYQHGRGAAKEIVDRFTGPYVPPPVTIGKRPDDAVADSDGGGE